MIYCLVDSIVAGFQRWVNVLILFRALNFSYVVIVVVATCGTFLLCFSPVAWERSPISAIYFEAQKSGHICSFYIAQLIAPCVHIKICSCQLHSLIREHSCKEFQHIRLSFLFNRNFSLSLAVRWSRWLERGEIRGISCWTTWAWFSLHLNYRCRLYNSHFFHWKSPWRNIKCSKLKCTAATVLCGSGEH